MYGHAGGGDLTRCHGDKLHISEMPFSPLSPPSSLTADWFVSLATIEPRLSYVVKQVW